MGLTRRQVALSSTETAPASVPDPFPFRPRHLPLCDVCRVLMDLPLDTAMLIACLLGLGAGLMRGFSGFGTGMLLAPVYAVLFGPAATIIMINVMDIAVSAQLIPRAMRQVQWKFILPLVTATATAMPFGAYILMTVDREVLTRVIAGLVIIFVIILATGWRYNAPKSIGPTIGIGLFAGTLSTSIGVSGPPVLLYILSGRDPVAVSRANIIAFFAVTNFLTLGIMWANGLMDLSAVLRGVMATPGFMLGAWLGARAFDPDREKLYRHVALLVLLCVGLYGVLR